MSKKLLSGAGVDVGYGSPLSLFRPNSSRTEAMSMWMGTDRFAKCLGYGDDAGTSPRVAGGFRHQLLDGFVSEPSQVC
jgi:hypothetical protein